MEMETEAPARHGTVVANPKKRPLDEVVPPAFVAEEEGGGAYGVVEMPKRFEAGKHRKHHDKYSSRMAAFYAMDARMTALNESLARRSAALIQSLRAEDAARAAAAGQQAAGDS